MYFAGTIGLLMPFTQPYFKVLSPFNLWVSLILLLLFHQDFNKSFVWCSIIIFCSGFIVEVIGVHSGIIFGEYWYGQTLGTSILDVPLVIGANWLILIYCSAVVTQNLAELINKRFRINYITDNTFFKALLASGMMVCLDYLIEPVAIHLDFWHWTNEQVPLLNFQAWFVIAFILAYLFLNGKFLKSNLLAPVLLFLQFLFFLSIYSYYLLIE
jgi:putative membrane protein